MIASSLLVGVGVFYATFFVISFLWLHLVVKNPQDVSPADGVVVIAGWFIFGTVLGLTSLILVLVRFWPRPK